MLALVADGTRVKSGGRVVKNVTGYDLHRLWCGSHGTLCFLLEATLRLYPAPAATAVLETCSASLGEGLARSHALWRAGVQPLCAVLRGEEASWELAVVLAGREEAVASEIETARAALGPVALRLGDDARRARSTLRECELASGAWPQLVLLSRPSRLAGALEHVASELGLSSRLLVHPLLASAAVELPGAGWSDERAAAFERALAGDGVELRWRGLGSRVSPRTPPAAVELMRRKQSLDPQGVFGRTLP
jgi:hypothetical protein